MSAQRIPAIALAEGLTVAGGKAPACTMGPNFHPEGVRKAKQGSKRRFLLSQKGKPGLAAWLDQGAHRPRAGARAGWCTLWHMQSAQ